MIHISNTLQRSMWWDRSQFGILLQGIQNDRGWTRNVTYAALDTIAMNYTIGPTRIKYQRLPDEIRAILSLIERRQRAERFVELLVRLEN